MFLSTYLQVTISILCISLSFFLIFELGSKVVYLLFTHLENKRALKAYIKEKELDNIRELKESIRRKEAVHGMTFDFNIDDIPPVDNEPYVEEEEYNGDFIQEISK